MLQKDSSSSKGGKAGLVLEEAETYTQTLDELIRRLKTDLKQGLSQRDAEDRIRIIGPNLVPRVRRSLFRIYIAPFMNWLISIYLIISTILACFAFLILPEVWFQVSQWLAVISINALIAMVQQERAQIRLTSLQRLSAPKSHVMREGKSMEISSEQLVPGDVMTLREGDRINADARIIRASSLRVNEAALTGESQEVMKLEEDAAIERDTAIQDRKNMVFLGTFVTAGSAQALVVATGRWTQIGRMAKSLEELNIGELPLRRKLNRLARNLGLTVLIYLSVALTYNLVQLYLNDDLFTDGLLNTRLIALNVVRSLTTAMSVMPINIPLLVTIVLITGIIAMAKYQVIIRNGNAVESLGRVSVVCSDKTGTITKNEMTVKWIYCPETDGGYALYGVTGVGFQPHGVIIRVIPDRELEEVLTMEPKVLTTQFAEVKPDTPLETLLASGLLNNDSSIVLEKVKDKGWDGEKTVYKVTGDATDASLLFLFHKTRLDSGFYKTRFEELWDCPFDSKLKRMTAFFKDHRDNKYVLFTKGATDVLLARCSTIIRGGNQAAALDDEEKGFIENQVSLFSRTGYRVISFASKNYKGAMSKDERELLEQDLTYLGFVAIMDPPREGVRESVFEVKCAGIKPVMITGDSVETAKNVAQQVGITEEHDLAVEGQVIPFLTDEDFNRTSVFARTAPRDKMVIVDRYKMQNRVVAMTGDGVNDAQAILMADVGVAMGITGTDAAKQSADVIIADDSFNSIVRGIRQGRGVFRKIQNVVFFYVAVNLAEAAVYFGSSLIPSFYLLNTWQQMYIFLLAHSIPPFALIIDSLSKDVMREQPRDNEDLFGEGRYKALLIFSVSLALILYTAYYGVQYGFIPVFPQNKQGYVPSFDPTDYLNPVDWAQAKARTMLHTVAFVAECVLVLSLRRVGKSMWKALREENHWPIWPFIILVPIIHLTLMFLPGTQMFLSAFGIKLEVVQLSLIDWLIALALGVFPVVLLELYKVIGVKADSGNKTRAAAQLNTMTD